MPRIVSANNSRLKEAAHLLRSAHERRRSNLCVIEGEHLLEAYIARHGAPRTLIVTETYERHPLTLRLAGCDTEPYVVDDALFKTISSLPPAIGMLAVIVTPEAQSLSGDFNLLLDEVQDPGNAGTILRSAAAAGVTHVVFSKNSASAWSPKVLRAAQGAHFSLDIVENVDAVSWTTQFRSDGGIVAVTTLRNGVDLFGADLSMTPLVLAVGNEGAGTSESLLNLADMRLTIPMPGGTESLNVAAAAAITLFERVRQQRTG
ncbi:MAG: RNA methyltransferase [Burkholderiales bacterium]|nr:RNA methyltransferase [Burkholderiales bacterium]